ncbi:MAG: molecular chaperone HtpG [Bacteroidia bacterium]|nr:molecular chaperone HtpG [Bacteroidia bacterium]
MTTEPLQKEQGSISVNTENIFPIIKRSLYSDHEIFLRELISNALDATQKLTYLSSKGEFEGELGDLTIRVSIDKEAKTITVSDNGLGMTGEEVRQYINQVAFSGAEEFVKKYSEAKDAKEIIGRFGLGFYSAFMVSSEVEIQTLSFREEAQPVHWTCDGSTSYTLDAGSRTERGTSIILHIDGDSEEFLDSFRLKNILSKYFKFVAFPVALEDEVINPVPPLWKKTPSGLEDKDYLEFYKTLYPFGEDPLFWIHLNIDHPFNLTGILYFPKIKKEIDPNRNRIHLYSRQVFITDEVKDIVPEYLMLLQGVIDSPDIPLNVSRSYLQSDSNVKKISGYITRKVADKLSEIFKEDRAKFEEKWEDISLFIKYGMITDEKFNEKAEKFLLLKSTSGKYYTMDEFRDFTAHAQTDKEENFVVLYTNDEHKQDLYIKTANDKGYEVVIMDGFLDSHLIGHLERKMEKTRWARIDSDTIDKLIPKSDDEDKSTHLNEEQQNSLKSLFQKVIPNELYKYETREMGENQLPVVIIRNEFMRRMQEMNATGGMGGFNFPENLEVMLNTSHASIQKLLETQDETLAQELMDLALLTQDLLKGKDLTAFIQRTVGLLR